MPAARLITLLGTGDDGAIDNGDHPYLHLSKDAFPECERLTAELLALQIARYEAGFINAQGTFEDGSK